MTAAGEPQWDEIVSAWGHAYTLSRDPGQFPDEPCAACRRDGFGTIRAASPAVLLDAIKDDAIARPFTGDAA